MPVPPCSSLLLRLTTTTTTNHISNNTSNVKINMKNTSNYQNHYYPCYHYHQNQQEHGVLEDGRENLRPYQKDSLFEKPLTPSDVGKLNRLVIPKHHAERHFPLDPNSVEKGLLLSFVDEAGKPWRFRYSYWSSSQSYVFTKGWSQFVKEKRLDAGDIVLFERGRSNGDRLYIRWKRRGEVTPAAVVGDVYRSDDASGKSVEFGSGPQGYNCHFTSPSDGSMQQEEEHQCHVKEGTTTSMATKNPKRLRLFGVNLEYGIDPSKSSDPITIHGGSGELVSSIVDQTELQHLPCNGFSSTSY